MSRHRKGFANGIRFTLIHSFSLDSGNFYIHFSSPFYDVIDKM